MADDTVKIDMTFQLSDAPYALEQKADTGLTRREWDALTAAERNEVAGKSLDEWTEELYDVYWEEAE